jgi:hypothetical protein
MNPPNHNSSASPAAPGAGEAERTLRLIANLPIPEGLEDRVKNGLRIAPRAGRVLHWPSSKLQGRSWLNGNVARGAAAAAIVLVVLGGGWGLYSRVQPAQLPQAIAMPRVAAPGSFSSAGAMRTPQTLNGPVLNHPLTNSPKPTSGSGKTKEKENASRKNPHDRDAADTSPAGHESAPSSKQVQ